MKKITCMISGLMMIMTVPMFAQETHFGIKAGVNISSVEVSNGDDWKSKSGLHFGGLAHIHINRSLAIQPELVFSMQGGKDDGQELKLNYLNLPVNVQYMVNNFRLQTGPQLGFLLSARLKDDDVSVDVDEDINSIDFSWTFGMSYLFPQGFGLDARYNLGISNISDDTNYEAHNRVFQFGIFYQFMHGRRGR